MPKATRANDNETPKKRSRKAKPANGICAEAVQPVTTAPAIATTTPEAKATVIAAPPKNGHTPIPEDKVRHRAYELYLQRDGQGGSPEQDWFQALQEIASQHVA
jgi:hypothetical protein